MKHPLKAVITILLLAVCMVALAISLDRNQGNPKVNQTTPTPTATPQVDAKKLANILEEKLTADSPAYRSQDDLVFLTRAIARNDMETIRSARDAGRIILLKKNDRFLKTDIDQTTDSKKIYLTSGAHYGQSFWVPNLTPSIDAN